ncbi:MAG TPA: type II toxin-antitoxin system VapC family toxin [Myxococcaceae bacterium]|nr:type II toxin-antitoxin system VapC family toxin [Myxococcaceae bacterium]
MRRLLDTDICVALLKDDQEARARLLAEDPGDVCLCSVVKAELLYGARHSKRVDPNLRRLERFFAPFESLPFDDAAAHWYGTIRAHLARVGRPIGGNDLLIAAIALAQDVTVVTRNTAEFNRVPNIRLEAW